METSPDYFKYPMVQTYVSLARSYKMKGNIIDAFQRYERALDVCYINNADVLIDDIRRQMVELKLGDHAPEDIRTRQSEVRRMLHLKENLQKADFDYTKKEVNELIQSGSKDPELYILLGTLALQENKKEEAAHNLFYAAQYCYNIRAVNKAETYCKQVLRLDPNRLEARILLIEIYRRTGSTNLASIEMLTVVREYLKKNQLPDAFTYVQKAVDIGNMEAHYIQGLIHFHKGQLDEAKEKFELVNKINERHAGALSFLARIYQKQNLIDNALETYHRLVELTPHDPEVYFKLAHMQLKGGLRKEAVGNYQKASQLFSQQGKTQEAEGATRMADQLWHSLQEDEKIAETVSPQMLHQLSQTPSQLIRKRDEHTDEKRETSFNQISNDRRYSAWELVSLYKETARIDPHNKKIQDKLRVLEETITRTPVPSSSPQAFVIPVNDVELVLFTDEAKQLLKDKFTTLLESHPADQKLQAKLKILNEENSKRTG